MSLDFNLSNIENYEDVCLVEIDDVVQYRATTNSILYATILLGMNEITDKNWMEFYARVNIWEKLFGSFMTDQDRNPVSLTAIDIKNHIGLHTNASLLTNTQFKNRVFKQVYDDAIFKAKREILND